jgi:hypothetical protein
MRHHLLALFLCLLSAVSMQAQQASDPWKSVEDALGRKGSVQAADVYKVNMPRSDLKVTVQGTEVRPGLALGSWAAFRKFGDRSLVMGDLVLTDSEVGPVMAKLQQGGIEQTALHNHLLNETPHVMYMHIMGYGDAAQLATTLREALALTGTPAAVPASTQNADLGFETSQIDQAMGRSGKNNNGIYQFAIPRAETIRDMDIEVPPAMGTATSISFQPTGGGRAAISGDFVLRAKEVNPVIRALIGSGIAVTAIHSHMLGEQPRLFFMHFWANDDAVKLARGLRKALDETNSQSAR